MKFIENWDNKTLKEKIWLIYELIQSNQITKNDFSCFIDHIINYYQENHSFHNNYNEDEYDEFNKPEVI